MFKIEELTYEKNKVETILCFLELPFFDNSCKLKKCIAVLKKYDMDYIMKTTEIYDEQKREGLAFISYNSYEYFLVYRAFQKLNMGFPLYSSSLKKIHWYDKLWFFIFERNKMLDNVT